MKIRSSYLDEVFDDQPYYGYVNSVNVSVGRLFPHVDKFDTIAFCGMSGALVAPAVAVRLRKWMTLVRKPSDGLSHGMRVEGAVQGRYMILDDFISEGDTVRRIQEAILKVNPEMYCVGICTYKDPRVRLRNSNEFGGIGDLFIEHPRFDSLWASGGLREPIWGVHDILQQENDYVI